MMIYLNGRFYRRCKAGDPRVIADRVAMAFARDGKPVLVVVKQGSDKKV